MDTGSSSSTTSSTSALADWADDTSNEDFGFYDHEHWFSPLVPIVILKTLSVLYPSRPIIQDSVWQLSLDYVIRYPWSAHSDELSSLMQCLAISTYQMFQLSARLHDAEHLLGQLAAFVRDLHHHTGIRPLLSSTSTPSSLTLLDMARYLASQLIQHWRIDRVLFEGLATDNAAFFVFCDMLDFIGGVHRDLTVDLVNQQMRLVRRFKSLNNRLFIMLRDHQLYPYIPDDTMLFHLPPAEIAVWD